MTIPTGFTTDLGGMLDGPLGSDCVIGTTEFRGILNAEYRDQEDAAGLSSMVWTTILTVRDADLPAGTREGIEITIADVSYTLRKKGRMDDMGARELYVVARTA